MENNYPGQYNNGNNNGYRPYSSYTPFQNPYGGNIFAVSPEERAEIKKNYFSTFAMAIVHIIGGFVLAQIIFTGMMLAGYQFRETADGTAIFDWQYNIAGSIAPIIFCIGIFIFDKTRSREKLSSYFQTDKITGKFIVGYFGVLIFMYGAAMILENIILAGIMSTGYSPISERYLTETEITPLYLATEIIFTVILAPIAEELMFRGVVLRRLSTVSQRFAIFASAVCFGLMHGNLLQAVLGFCMGIVLGYAAVKTGSLILPIAGHMFINAFASSSDFVEYFIGEEISDSYFSAAIMLFLLIGFICLIAVLASGRLRFPEYNEYHRKRTVPIMVTCVSFWLLIAVYIYDIAAKFGPVTDKLLEQ